MSDIMAGYSYNGQLVYQTYEYRQRNHQQNDAGSRLADALPDGQGKEALCPTCEESYRKEELNDILENSLSDTSTQMPHELDAYRLTRYDLGEEVEVWDPAEETIKSAYQIQSSEGEAVILSPSRLLLRGTQMFVDDAKSRTSRSLLGGDRLIPIEFEPEFLLWIFAGQQTDSASRFKHLKPVRLNGASFSGHRSSFGTNISLESTELTDSGLVHAAILSGNKFETLDGLFEFNNRYIDVKIYSNGRVHIRAAEDLRSRNMAERFVTATQVVDQLAAEYLRWNELPRDEQYPPASFFKNLYEAANSQGLEVSADIDSMLKEYANLRNENLEDYYESE